MSRFYSQGLPSSWIYDFRFVPYQRKLDPFICQRTLYPPKLFDLQVLRSVCKLSTVK